MNIRTKLTLGIGMLFCFILFLSLISVLKIHHLSEDTRNILRDNYNTLDYSRQMLRSLDEQQESHTGAMMVFRNNLQEQQKNITENGEQEFTDNLKDHFQQYQQDRGNNGVAALMRKDINDIMHINMDAISRKSIVAEKTAANATMWITATGTLSFLIALLLLLNLPGNIANPIGELTRSIEDIAGQQYNRRVHFKSGSEFGKLSVAFNTMAEKLEEYHDSRLSALLMEKKRIDTLINNMQDPVIGLDEHNLILFVNNEALQISGLKKEQLIGKRVQDIAVHNDLIRFLIKDLIPAGAQASTLKAEPLKIYANNKESYFDKETVKISIIPTGENRKQDIGHVILLKNITSFKELDTAKTNFIATVSHELKTPLSSIKMSVQLLMKPHTGKLNEEQEQLLDSIEEDSNRLLRITGELLNMTQVETGNIQLNIKKNKPEEIVDYAMDAVAFLAERKNITLIRQAEQPVPEVHADADKTAWVLVNFLTNAIRYSDEGSRITISLSAADEKILFSVQDSGKGIAPEYRDKIFDRYFQVPGSAKTGTGLGLAISKEFIEAQGGHIGVESTLCSGSRFYFSL